MDLSPAACKIPLQFARPDFIPQNTGGITKLVLFTFHIDNF